ncbi:cytochrome P450 [Pseudonocardia adelaidensis]|uniref:Cytochrome P450 n=1 Tax=Pseudonocardia adelaidensis TaxID=648754 RepID=A0ABP9NSF6_9PSEU
MLAVPPPCAPPRWTALPDGVEGWLVTRYGDARAVLSDPRFIRDPARVARLRGAAGLAPAHGRGFGVGRGSTLLHVDPPEHTRLRRAVGPMFTTRRAESHGSLIDELARTLVGRCAGSGMADLVCDLAVPLAVGVLCQVAGLPPADHARFGPSVRRVHRIDQGSGAGQRTVEAISALDRYLEERIARGRASGVLAELVDSERLSEDEVIALGRDLLVGGYESTANLISGGLALLLAEPSRYERVRRDPTLVGATVEESLHQVAPFPELEARYAAEAVEVGGTLISAGDAVVVNVAAANRDPDRFPAAERWSVDEPGGHLSFGHGAHHCLGAVLARREADAALRAVINGLGDLRLGCRPEELEWEPGLSPGLRSLPVRFTARPPSGHAG